MSREYEKRKLEYLSNFRDVAKSIKEKVQLMDPNSKIYLFGSLLKGKYTGSSDIDILIISDKKELEYKIKLTVYSSTEAPVQIHFCSEEEFKNWYMKFIDKIEKV
jgi:predicted nucleotidyltransferase